MLVEIDGRWINPAKLVRLESNGDSASYLTFSDHIEQYVHVNCSAADVAKKINDAELEFQKQAFLASHNAFMNQPIVSNLSFGAPSLDSAIEEIIAKAK